MSVYFEGRKVKEMYWAGRKVKEAWYGGKKVYSTSAPWWLPNREYRKGDQVTVEIYGDIYKYTALVDHYSMLDSKPFYGDMEKIYWGSPTKVN
ncbi:hypothetical protein [Corynebacterium striatum]|uniref:hypothetical protein n=1 Tax=Corynebacterium striatum TaxID=43770 RepID=UPI003B59231F